MAKGIRINQLAKDLGVESKAILAKCRDEGLGAKVPNHMSVVSIGLAETIREWFSGHDQGGGTAVEIAPPVEVATKPRTSRLRSKKKMETGEDAGDDNGASDTVTTAVADARSDEAGAPVAAPAESAPTVEAPPEAPPAVWAAPIVETPMVHETPQVESSPPVQTPEMPGIAASSPAVAPAPDAPSVAPKPSVSGAVVHDLNRPPQLRETITLANRPGLPPAVRKPVTPAPAMRAPAPAVIQGPNVVRVEKPEVVSAPRPRRTIGDGPSGPNTGFTTARPGVGRGVKPADDEDEKKAAAKKSGASLSARRRGADGRRGEAMEKLREFTEADLIARRDALNAAGATRAAFDRHIKQSERRGTHIQAKTAVERGEPISIEEPITVKTLSAALGIKTNDILKKLMQQGVFANVNQTLDADTAAAIALNYGIELQVAQRETMEEVLMGEFDARYAAQAEQRVSRPAVVTILGHVDHGKTSLLDKIRSANVAAGEAGGITQHTAAWQVIVGEGDARKQVTFIDTPGHQAFTSMRARGANMTDVVVLVVGAPEGVMPQTIESINHARAAGVPIVVALNKIDRAEANPDMVLGQLAQHGLNPVEWGGETEVIRTSAVTGQGIKELIEILDYQSQLLELKADPTAAARGSVIESRVHAGLGAIATVLVQDGTLHVGDVILSGPGYGRIRSLINDRGEQIQEAPPATPVIVSGLNILPGSGDKFFVLDDFDRARSIAEERATMSRQNTLSQQTKVTLDNLFATMKAGDVKTINLIIKGDVQGSVETLAKTVTDQNTEEVKIRVIHSAVGGITESDVELADASNAVIIGFHVVPDESARAMAEQRRVEIRLYRVIYEIFDDLKKALSGLLEPEIREKLHGHVEVRQVFKVSKLGNIAGCFVTDGHIQRGSKIRLIRDGKVITEDLAIETLRRVKDDVKEVKAGFECGIKLANYDDVKVGDRYEAYIRETFQRTL